MNKHVMFSSDLSDAIGKDAGIQTDLPPEGSDPDDGNRRHLRLTL